MDPLEPGLAQENDFLLGYWSASWNHGDGSKIEPKGPESKYWSSLQGSFSLWTTRALIPASLRKSILFSLVVSFSFSKLCFFVFLAYGPNLQVYKSLFSAIKRASWHYFNPNFKLLEAGVKFKIFTHFVTQALRSQDRHHLWYRGRVLKDPALPFHGGPSCVRGCGNDGVTPWVQSSSC